mmetsp:Transcript_17401/g.42520  ORF Transcript_17401/g.42520 Transcript_17401/m.42520 type:complete len:251 (+) Transcript_17401:985-1737(+)
MEGGSGSEHAQQAAPEAPHVAAVSHPPCTLQAEGLRAHVLRCAHERARPHGRRRRLCLLDELAHAKVGHDKLVGLREQQVVGLEVPVDDADAVELLQSAAQSGGVPKRPGLRHATLPAHLAHARRVQPHDDAQSLACTSLGRLLQARAEDLCDTPAVSRCVGKARQLPVDLASQPPHPACISSEHLDCHLLSGGPHPQQPLVDRAGGARAQSHIKVHLQSARENLYSCTCPLCRQLRTQLLVFGPLSRQL